MNIPYTFIAGTKAKAEEVNANFIELAEKIDETKKAISTEISSKADDPAVVHKTGDETIKGIKIFSNELAYGSYGRTVFKNSGFANITLQSTEIQDGVVPAANRYAGIEFRDKNNARIGYLGIGTLANGRQYFDLQTQGSTSGFSFPKCTTKPTTISSASNHKVAVVVQNYVNGNSWYRVWSDGWIEQGGIAHMNDSANQRLTFLKAFTNTSYTFVSSADGYNSTANIGITAREKGAVTYDNSYGSPYNWYICGY